MCAVYAAIKSTLSRPIVQYFISIGMIAVNNIISKNDGLKIKMITKSSPRAFVGYDLIL